MGPSASDERYLVPMCCIGAVTSVKALLERGAPVDYVNAQGWTPLLAAAFAGQAEVVAMLIENGARADRKTVHGDGLTVACRQGHVECVRLLLGAGCLANAATLGECYPHPAVSSLVKKYTATREPARAA